MQLFTRIKDADLVSKRGERQVSLGMATDTGKHLLTHFVFTPKRPNLFPCNYEFDWNSLTLSALPSGTGTVFAIARVAFYQMVNGEGYMLSGGHAFGVQVVGI